MGPAANPAGSGDIDEMRQYFWGVRYIDEMRQYFWGVRYIDDIVAHRVNSDLDDEIDDSRYHLTDAQFSTVAVMGTASKIFERVSYSPYGVARHHWPGDVDGDGDQDNDDRLAINSALGTSIDDAGYIANADLNRDGEIDNADKVLAGQGFPPVNKTALAAGELSGLSIGNQIGFDGYTLNTESLLNCIRTRDYDPMLSRWLDRDKMGIVDGINLFTYCNANPVRYTDPTGQTGVEPGVEFIEGFDVTPIQAHASKLGSQNSSNIRPNTPCTEGDPDSSFTVFSGCRGPTFMTCSLLFHGGDPGSIGGLWDQIVGAAAAAGRPAGIALQVEGSPESYAWLSLFRLCGITTTVMSCQRGCDDCWFYKSDPEKSTSRTYIQYYYEKFTRDTPGLNAADFVARDGSGRMLLPELHRIKRACEMRAKQINERSIIPTLRRNFSGYYPFAGGTEADVSSAFPIRGVGKTFGSPPLDTRSRNFRWRFLHNGAFWGEGGCNN
jgi:RHS repeat-associated protein